MIETLYPMCKLTRLTWFFGAPKFEHIFVNNQIILLQRNQVIFGRKWPYHSILLLFCSVTCYNGTASDYFDMNDTFCCECLIWTRDYAPIRLLFSNSANAIVYYNQIMSIIRPLFASAHSNSINNLQMSMWCYRIP